MDVSASVALGVVAFGILTGVLSALFGVGGGLVMVPFMVLALGSDQHLAEGTSLLVIVPTAIVGVIAHTRRGYVSFKHAALLAVGGVVGSFLGATLALQLEEGALQVIFGAFLALMGVRTVVQALKR
ncbi:MAG TPA: sulfite exporter TauE/SafE family protein [Actinomycetota bacterium]|nr:sulfite exporter TauE/SafE family protein [Actinomycetota bacterium]